MSAVSCSAVYVCARAGGLGLMSLVAHVPRAGQRAGFAGGVEADNPPDAPRFEIGETTDYDECLACQ